MADALYVDGGGFLTADGTMTLAMGRAYGGSTVVYTGTSIAPPRRVVERWAVPGIEHADLEARCRKYMAQNGVHLLRGELINDNNRLFVDGCRRLGLEAEQFPLNLRGCVGSSLCNLGCPNLAKQGTHRVQLPAAERAGVEVVTRAEALRVEERAVAVKVHAKPAGAKGAESEWAPGEYRVRASVVVLAGGAVGTSALLLRSRGVPLPRGVGESFTCHPALILAAEHDEPITNDVGHPKSFYLDRGAEEGYVLETCMYFPFVLAKSLTGFGPDHSRLMRAFPRLQQILVLACDQATHHNRVAVDAAGDPVVHYHFTQHTVERFARATRTAARIFFAAGARAVHAPLARRPLIEREDAGRIDELVRAEHFVAGKVSVSAAHMMGGCAMGVPGEGVTDAWGRVHGVPWLRVADSSLFPDALQINPYLTIMALADRTAEGVRRDVSAMLDATPRADRATA